MRGGSCGWNVDTAHTVCLEKSHVSLQDRDGTGICVFLCGKSAGRLSDDPGCQVFCRTCRGADKWQDTDSGAVGVLGSENKVIKQMQYGGIDFARVSLAQLAEYIPSLNVLQMPYLYTDSDHMWRVLDGEIGDAFLESVSADDVIGLSWYDAGARNFYNSVKPVTCLEDLKDMRIRVQESDLAVDMVEALGATAIPIAYGDVYASLERQVVDGAENNWPSYEAMRHYEVAKYYTVDEHSRVPEMQICSAYTWQKLSPEDREIILECARESAIYEREVWTQREEQSRSIAMENGTKVVELSAEEKKRFQNAVYGVYEKYCGDDMGLIEEILKEGS